MPARETGWLALRLAVSLLAVFLTKEAHGQQDVEASWRPVYGAGKFDGALKLARDAENAATRGTRPYWLARILQAETLSAKRDTKAATALLHEIDEGIKHSLGAQDVLQGRALADLAEAVGLSEPAKALPLLHEARGILASEPRSEAALDAAVLESIFRLQQGQAKEALAVARRGREDAKAAGDAGQYHLLRLEALAARELVEMGQNAEARELYEGVVGRLDSAKMSDFERGVLLASLAQDALLFDDHERGLDFGRRAARWFQVAVGRDYELISTAQTARADHALALSLSSEAVDAAEDAFRITKLGKPSSEELAVDEFNLGTVLTDAGRLDEAERLLLAAQAAMTGTDSGKRALRARIAFGLGRIYGLGGYLQGAQRSLQQALTALSNPSNREEKLLLASILSEQGDEAQLSASTEEAIRDQGKSLSLRIEVLGPEASEVGLALSSLGADVVIDGRPEDAEPLLRRAVQILDARLGVDRAPVPHFELASCLAQEHKLPDASAALLSAFRAGNRALEGMIPRARPEDLRRFVATQDQTTALASALAVAPGATPEVVRDSLRIVLTRKALDLDVERVRNRDLRASARQDTLLDRLRTARTEFASVLLRGAPSAEQVQTMRRKIDDLELELSERASASTAPLVRVIEPADVARALPPQSALVEFAFLRQLAARDVSGGSPHLAAYVLRADGTVSAHDLGDQQILGPKIAAIRKAVQAGEQATDGLRDAYTLLVAPWQDRIADVRHLFVSPDGPLALLPIEIFIRPDGRHVLEATPISYLTSGRDLVDLRDARPLRADFGPALIVGDPDYDYVDPSAVAPAIAPLAPLGRVRWPRLSGTAQEVHALAAILPGATVRLGSAADETTVLGAGDARLLHVATHGFFLDPTGRVVSGSRGLALDTGAVSVPTHGGEQPESGTPLSEALSDEPLIRSGLVLAGANAKGVGRNDGYLTASELAGLDLSSMDLVVLSACETGVAETSAGLGVMGLRRSLALAGARRQVMSLWKVDDAATAALMERFYGNLRAGMESDEALRSAQLALLAQRDWSAPYFWGAFQLSGDWRPIVASGGTSSGSGPVAALRVPPRSGCGQCTQSAAGGASTPWGVAASGAFAAAVLARRRRRSAVAVAVVSILTISTTARADPPIAVSEVRRLDSRAEMAGLQGDYATARTLRERTLRAEPDEDIFLFDAGELAKQMGDPKAARDYYVRAADAAVAVHAYARVQGFMRSAEASSYATNPAIARALEHRSALSSALSNAATADVDMLVSQGGELYVEGRSAEALAKAQQASQIVAQALPSDALRRLAAKELEATVLAGTGDASAIAVLNDAIATVSGALGKDSPDVITARIDLGASLRSLHRNAESIAANESVAVDAEARYGKKDNPYAITARANEVEVLVETGQNARALELAASTIGPCRALFGPHDTFCTEIARSQARAEFFLGRIDAARTDAAHAMAEILAVSPTGGYALLIIPTGRTFPSQPDFLDALDILTRVELGKQKAELGLPFYEARHRVLTRYVGATALPTLRTAATLVQLELAAGKGDEATHRLLETQGLVDRDWGMYAPVAIELAMFGAKTLAGAGRFREVEALAESASRRALATYGPDHLTSIVARFNEGFVKAHLGRPNAPGLLRDAFARAAQVLGPKDATTTTIQKEMAKLGVE